MAQPSTLYRFLLELSNIDQNVYTTLDLRVPCHPSEDAERLVIRVLARALAHEEGLVFGRGLSHAADATLWTKTLDGQIVQWIDVGCPSAERLHRASKAAQRVLVVTNKNDAMLRKEWSSRSIHNSKDIALIRLPDPLVQSLAASLQRTVQWYITVFEGGLQVSDGIDNWEGPLTYCTLPELL